MKRAVISTLAAGGLILSSAAAALASVDVSPRGVCTSQRGCVGHGPQRNHRLHRGVVHFGDRPRGHGEGTSRPRRDRHRDLRVLPWTASADGSVDALTVAGGSVYVGGAFTHVNGSARPYLAAVSASDGTLRSFNPGVDTPIRALAATSTTVFVGGDLTRVGSVTRSGLAAFDASSGALVSGWAPSVNRAVNVMAVSAGGSSLYFGGTFTRVNGDTSRQRLAAVSTSTGAALTTFQPNVPDPVLALDTDARGIYVGTGGPGGHLLTLESRRLSEMAGLPDRRRSAGGRGVRRLRLCRRPLR